MKYIVGHYNNSRQFGVQVHLADGLFPDGTERSEKGTVWWAKKAEPGDEWYSYYVSGNDIGESTNYVIDDQGEPWCVNNKGERYKDFTLKNYVIEAPSVEEALRLA